MVTNELYTALDIGDSTVKLVIGSVHNGKLDICATYQNPTKGVKDGEIFSKTELLTVLNTMFDQARNDGFTIKSLILVLPGNNINIYRKKAENIIPQTRIISPADIQLLKKAVCKHKILDHEMVVGILPIQYLVGNDSYKGEPVGVRGGKIVLDAFLIAVPISVARGYVDLIQDMDFEVSDAIVSPLANAALLLKGQEYKQGALILDLGATSNSVSAFYNYLFCGYRHGDNGVERIINEIVRNYDIDVRVARSIFYRYGTADVNAASSIPLYQFPDSERKASEVEIATLVDNALNIILSEVKENIEFIIRDSDDLPLIITGCGAMIPGIEKKCENFLGIKTYARNFGRIGGFDPRFNAAIGGLIHYLAKKSLISIRLIQI